MSENWSTSEKESDPKQAIAIEKKKTKVLKSALKEMRKEREVVDRELERARENIVALNNQLQEKVSTPSQLLFGLCLTLVVKNAIGAQIF